MTFGMCWLRRIAGSHYDPAFCVRRKIILYKLMRLALWILSESFDKSLTFVFVHATLYLKSDHFTYIKPLFDFIFRPAATPNYFAAIHLRQNPLAPARRIFISLKDLQPLDDHRLAILYTHLDNFISRPDWIPQDLR